MFVKNKCGLSDQSYISQYDRTRVEKYFHVFFFYRFWKQNYIDMISMFFVFVHHHESLFLNDPFRKNDHFNIFVISIFVFV